MARYTNIEGQGEEALVLGLPAERVAITGEGKVILSSGRMVRLYNCRFCHCVRADHGVFPTTLEYVGLSVTLRYRRKRFWT